MPRKCHNHEAPKEEEEMRTNNDKTNVTYETTDGRNKVELQQTNRHSP